MVENIETFNKLVVINRATWRSLRPQFTKLFPEKKVSYICFLKKPALKKVLIFSPTSGNRTFLDLRFKNLLYFLKRHFSYLLGSWTFRSIPENVSPKKIPDIFFLKKPALEKFLIFSEISGNRTFLDLWSKIFLKEVFIVL